ncbi:hypothetical protein [Serratia marcescens]
MKSIDTGRLRRVTGDPHRLENPVGTVVACMRQGAYLDASPDRVL